ncbi:hypothetical protein VKT23_003538 [Stygiomarasmius scandens]|uniref:MARVEL domain-containing protein n=1 Tax=Marasmiellus scandens TaxID=2682957 RepID=A0ABR1JYA3_9AGAR
MGSDVTIVGPTLSRSLLLHPIQIAFYFAILVLFIVLGFSGIENAAKIVLVCSIVSVVFCLTTFVVDAVFYAIVLRRVHGLGFVSHVKMGAAFVVTIVQVIIALTVAATVWWIDNGRKLFRRNRKARVVREKVAESHMCTFSEPEQAHTSIVTT